MCPPPLWPEGIFRRGGVRACVYICIYIYIYTYIAIIQGAARRAFPRNVDHFLGSDFGRTDFSRIFIFGPPDFSRILSPDFFSSFLWKKCPEKSSRKIPGKILQNLYNKNPQQLSAEGPGQHFFFFFVHLFFRQNQHLSAQNRHLSGQNRHLSAQTGTKKKSSRR